MSQTEPYDAIIIGGGPSGATAALMLARSGKRAVIVEKSAFPRFQIGESFLPANFEQIKRLGLLERLRALPHMPKYGAEFAMGDGPGSVFLFNTGLVGGENETFNIARAEFDRLMLDAALEAGAELRQPQTVKHIDRLADGDVVVTTTGGVLRGRYLIDASGQATVVARQLGTRRALDEPHLRKVAYFGHFEGVERLEGRLAGCPTVVMCDEGWFWIIPISPTVTSVGLVLSPEAVEKAGVGARQMLAWGVDRCPVVKTRMRQATGEALNMVRSDFSYRCEPYAGEGYFLVGDAATFLDPVFSTGVCLGMMGAEALAKDLIGVIDGRMSPQEARRKHVQYIRDASGIYFRVIRQYYTHEFRELFLHGRGPVDMHRGVLALLAGHVFPRPPMKLRWRYAAFEQFIRIHRRVPLVPLRRRFSLFHGPMERDGRPLCA